MIDSSLSKEATIYSYRLVKKIIHTNAMLIIVWSALALFISFHLQRGGSSTLLLTPLCAFALQSLVARIYIRMVQVRTSSVWRWRFGTVWNGFLPEGFAPLSLVKRVHSNTFWIGLTAIGLLYPWLSTTVLTDMVFFHLWLLAPRSWILFRIHRKPTGSWIKIHAGHTSCYTQ